MMITILYINQIKYLFLENYLKILKIGRRKIKAKKKT
jgi:hypothetical protein